jgi:S-DNA-T family DNA segregation ATPase FtsK/SpoIIIE
MVAIGWWLHAAALSLWPFLLVFSDLAAIALMTLGRHIGLGPLRERFYAAVVALVVGGWLAIAAILGPVAWPMLPLLGLGALILAVPWWADRRRRAWARAQRAISAWPDVAEAIGLPGARIQFARVDAWGWRAVVKLAPGQTIADVIVRVPAIESALGTYRGAVRVSYAREDRANLFVLRVLETKPSGGATP